MGQKQYKLGRVYTPNSTMVKEHKYELQPVIYSNVYNSKEDALRDVRRSNKDQTDSFGEGLERILFYLVEEDVPVRRHWVLFKPREAAKGTFSENSVLIGTDRLEPELRYWTNSEGYYGSGTTYAEAFQQVSLLLDENGL